MPWDGKENCKSFDAVNGHSEELFNFRVGIIRLILITFLKETTLKCLLIVKSGSPVMNAYTHITDTFFIA
tara:strand:- start:212 stop:421 length:210 start_codon:yes stop_codon:yes gene_type:complete